MAHCRRQFWVAPFWRRWGTTLLCGVSGSYYALLSMNRFWTQRTRMWRGDTSCPVSDDRKSIKSNWNASSCPACSNWCLSAYWLICMRWRLSRIIHTGNDRLSNCSRSFQHGRVSIIVVLHICMYECMYNVAKLLLPSSLVIRAILARAILPSGKTAIRLENVALERHDALLNLSDRLDSLCLMTGLSMISGIYRSKTWLIPVMVNLCRTMCDFVLKACITLN